MFAMHDYIDIYCERLNPGLWAEPLNAVTNMAFIVAAAFAFLCARKNDALDIRGAVLITLIFAIGVGSGLFHTFATRWAMLADVLPILVFQICFILFYSQKIVRLKGVLAFLPLLGFFIVTVGAGQIPGYALNGSLQYAPALIFVTGFGVYHYRYAQMEKYLLLLAAGVFVCSLTFRSIDMEMCASIRFGTHFLWHVLNAFVLYLSVRAYLINIKR